MPVDDNTKRLEARIAQLESKLASAGRQEPAEITAEEMKAYRKVRDVIAADWGEFCGINDCFRCIRVCGGGPCVIRCIVRCINECVCGPCSPGGGGPGGGGQFGGFGG